MYRNVSKELQLYRAKYPIRVQISTTKAPDFVISFILKLITVCDPCSSVGTFTSVPCSQNLPFHVLRLMLNTKSYTYTGSKDSSS